MSTAHAPEGVNPSTAPEQGTDTAVKTAEQNALNADSQKLDVSELKEKVEDPTIGNADESKELHEDDDVKSEGDFKKSDEEKVDLPPADDEIAKMQAIIDAGQAKASPQPKVEIADLLANLGKKAAPLQEHVADERPPRQFPLDNRRNRDERRGGKNRGSEDHWEKQKEDRLLRMTEKLIEIADKEVTKMSAAPAVVAPPVVALPKESVHVQNVTPAVEPPKSVAATQSTPKPPVVQPPAQVQNVVTPVPPPEDTEVANLRSQAARSNRNSVRPPWSPETNRRIGYWAMAVVAVLLGIWGLAHLLGDSKKSEVPQVPVDTVARVTPPAPTAANQVLLDKLQQMDNRLAEALPSQADLAMLDDKITEAENAAVTAIAHVPCFKDPNQERCRKAVKAERVYYDSDFSHPRDVALNKIPYEKKTADKPAPKKASKKVKKK